MKSLKLLILFSGLSAFSFVYADRVFSLDNIDKSMPMDIDYYYEKPHTTDYQYVASLGQGKGNFKTISIPGDALPQVWKITGSDGKKIECANDGVLKIADYALQYNNLLLEVNFYDKKANAFLATVIDLDGDGPYSEIIGCKILS